MQTTQKQTVYDETMLAYADCHGNRPWQETEKIRNLHFRASEPVSRDEAVKIMQDAVTNGYNNFRAELLAELPAGCKVTLAREGSVCVYVAPPIPDNLGSKMMADEVDTSGQETRLWWD